LTRQGLDLLLNVVIVGDEDRVHEHVCIELGAALPRPVDGVVVASVEERGVAVGFQRHGESACMCALCKEKEVERPRRKKRKVQELSQQSQGRDHVHHVQPHLANAPRCVCLGGGAKCMQASGKKGEKKGCGGASIKDGASVVCTFSTSDRW